MRQFNILLEDKPGELARVTAALSHVNIKNISTEHPQGGRGVVKLVTADENSTRSALQKAGFEFSEVDIFLVGLLDRPGELNKLAKRLGDEGVNIIELYLLDRGVFALAVDKSQHDKAKALLAENLI